jgi:ketosteroid isomerase-like protein
MSRENVEEVARRWVEAINAREIPDDLIAPDCRLENVRTAVTDKVYVGPDGVREWMNDFFDVLDQEASYEVKEIARGDDYWVGICRFVGRGSQSGAPLEMRYVGVAWIRNGKVTRGVGYSTVREALHAVGLSE